MPCGAHNTQLFKSIQALDANFAAISPTKNITKISRTVSQHLPASPSVSRQGACKVRNPTSRRKRFWPPYWPPMEPQNVCHVTHVLWRMDIYMRHLPTPQRSRWSSVDQNSTRAQFFGIFFLFFDVFFLGRRGSWWLLVAPGGSWWLLVAPGGPWWLLVAPCSLGTWFLRLLWLLRLLWRVLFAPFWGLQPIILQAICSLLDLGLSCCMLFAFFWHLNGLFRVWLQFI